MKDMDSNELKGMDSKEPLGALKVATDYTAEVIRNLGDVRFTDYPEAMEAARQFGNVIVCSMELYRVGSISVEEIADGVRAMLMTMYHLGYEGGGGKSVRHD